MAKLITLFRRRAPRAAADFFRRNPHQITPLFHETGPLPAETLKLVGSVNVYINGLIRRTTEDVDRWVDWEVSLKAIAEIFSGTILADPPRWEDDCEGYMWTKRRALAQVFGYGCLVPLILQTPTGGHMVLAICCTDETWILDSNQGQVIPLKKAHNPVGAYVGGKWLSTAVGDEE